MKKLLIFDGNSIVNRAFYGVKLLTNKEGLYTNAIYGFLNILLKYIENEAPDYMVIAFDLKAPTFRHKMYDGYKAGRKGMPEELAVQMPVLKEVLAAMNITMLSKEGFEADDIIGTVASYCDNNDIKCIIATGDRDSFQLASENTSIYLTSTRMGTTSTEIITPDVVKEKYLSFPSAMIDIKALMGDSSDNIPGVPGIGEKTACKLIAEYGSIENLYDNIDSIGGSVKTKLENGKDLAFLSKDLARIEINAPIDIDLNEFELKSYDNDKLAELLTSLEFKSIMNKLSLSAENTANSPVATINENIETIIIDNADGIENHINTIIASKEFSYYIFSDETGICSVAVLAENKLYFFSFGVGLLSSFSITDIKDIFECDTPKTTHSYKEDIILLDSYGIKLNKVAFDTSIAAYLDAPTASSYDIGLLMGFETYEEKFGKGKKQLSPAEIDPAVLAEYAKKLCAGIISLKETHTKLIEDRAQHQLYFDIELPLCRVLADMELAGFKVDFKHLDEYGKKLNAAITVLQNSIYEKAGGEFNINSPKQLGEVLFERLGLPVIKKTKTGYSTDADVLEKLYDKHEIIADILDFRTLIKLKSTYADGLLQVINKADGKIHSKFNQTVTATGRISSTEPNLQNIPVRMPLGREIRKMFVPTNEDYVLLDADYSQIELRILAHVSGDETLTDAFETGKDIHKITAASAFNVPIDDVTPEMRSNAKAVNFGIVYGISDFALAGDLRISRKMAKAYIDGYFSTYPGVKEYMDNIIAIAKEQGFVSTVLGRRRYIPELKSQKFVERSFGERVALNTPIQGSSADIIKIAMVNVYNALKAGGYKSRILLQVHDELIIEAHKSEVDAVSEILKENMENAFKLNVPLIADVHEGTNWYEAKA